MPHPKHLAGAAAVFFIGIAGALLVLHSWNLPPFQGTVETTENAYVRGQVTVISPQIAGYVTDVAVGDFDVVKAGQILFRIDERIFRQKLAQARAVLAGKQAALENSAQAEMAAEARIRSSEAQIRSARAEFDLAQTNGARAQSLLKRGIATQSAADQAVSILAQARAKLNQAEAGLDVARQELRSIQINRETLAADIQNAQAAVNLAEIDLQNTRITAPIDGKLGEIGVRLGSYVAPGSQLASLVPNLRWIIANFKETQLSSMRIGQMAHFSVDALNGAELSGQIVDFSPATGSEFSVLRADNATGNFTKIVQRLPVRIAIDDGQDLAARLVPGMSVVVSVDTASAAGRVAAHGAAAPGS